MSRAVIYEKFGGPEVLELRDVPEPHAGAGEIRVRVAAVGLNPDGSGLRRHAGAGGALQHYPPVRVWLRLSRLCR
jgi:NADPH:quinone reductase-like Zn-dependent oxidoreductase